MPSCFEVERHTRILISRVDCKCPATSPADQHGTSNHLLGVHFEEVT